MIADLTLPAGQSLLTPEDIVREVKHLPSAPKVLPRLKRLLSDGNSAMHEIVALIRLDPGIAVRVLQASNSAYFGNGLRCFTVDEAVGRVGYDQVYELVSYAVASQVLVRPLEAYGLEADELWKMSVACALAAEELAARIEQDRDVAYTVGLLHAVGMVAIDEWALRNARTLRFTSAGYPREATESERAALGFTSAQVGGALLGDWDFPGSIAEPVRWQYSPRSSASQAKMAITLHVAKWVRTTVCTPAAAPALPDDVYLRTLSLTRAQLYTIVAEVSRRISAVSSMLETETTVRPAGELFHPELGGGI
jgi:HD-like signal output (HDOD) protein